LKENYVFQWANDGKVGKSVKFSELFADKNTLLLYSFMYGPNWDNPSPSCTSLVDGFDRTWYQVTQSGAAFVAIAKAPAARINAWARQRGWSQIALVSGSNSTYRSDYKCQVKQKKMLPAESTTSCQQFCSISNNIWSNGRIFALLVRRRQRDRRGRIASRAVPTGSRAEQNLFHDAPVLGESFGLTPPSFTLAP
jgi:predicted dithiol-disulfide oxidoreductase (DUF899 family)